MGADGFCPAAGGCDRNDRAIGYLPGNVYRIAACLKAGANTIWEAWEGPNSTSGGIGSLNHYSKGAVVEWLFGEMCGIRVEGENRFTIAPKPGGSFTFAKAGYNSVYGMVECGWQKTDDGYTFTVTVPANTTATFVLPDGSRQALLPGTHAFACVTDRGNTVPTCDFG